MIKKLTALLLAALLLCCFCACVNDEYLVVDGGAQMSAGAQTSTGSQTDYVCISVKDFGDIYVELYPGKAPITVKNFKDLVAKNYYDGTTFHRVIEGFMIQGGRGAATSTIKGEFTSNGVNNSLKHERGVISMARATDKNSASSQFFICQTTERCTHLDGNYAAFGRVLAGMEVVDAIAAVDTGANDAPTTPVVIESVRFCEKPNN